MLLLSVVFGCSESHDVRDRPYPVDPASIPVPSDPTGSTPSGTSADDQDADGVAAPGDCDDHDPSIHPGTPERCDGIDQDCSGVADDGIVTDGAGCVDPGPPVDDGVVDLITVSVRTGDGVNDKTDGTNPTLCLAEDLCVSLGVPDWNDREVGYVDVMTIDGGGRPTAAFDRFDVTAVDGADAWRPAGFEVALDGAQTYCEDAPGVVIGDASTEAMHWADPNGWHSDCRTIWDSPLAVGPLIGMAPPGEARIWVRTSSTLRVAVYVADTSDGVDRAAPVAIGYPRPEDDFTWEAHLYGVTPGKTWFYAVDVDGVRSRTMSFTAPPPAGELGVYRFAFGSCSRFDDQPVFGSILGYDPDLFLFIGDNHYGNSSDLDAQRQYYRWAHTRASRSTMLSQTPNLATWDDHDFVGNNTLGTEAGRDTALRTFTEYWANPSYGLDTVPGVFTRATWGSVDWFVLDDRYYRAVETGSMIGADQEAWLIEAMASSTATFKLLASGSKWSEHGSSDSWAAYLGQRDRIEQALADRGVGGVILLSGDIHRSELRLEPGPAGGYDLPEIISSPLANDPSGCGSDDELVTCFDDTVSFVTLDVDTTIPDPTLIASIRDVNGSVVYAWTILRSQLEPGLR
ncbi:MAG: alkaline phosphatase D family protein [Myxococcota bacterium]